MENMDVDVPTGSHMALDQPFRSKLQDGPQRFLAYAIEHGLKSGRRSARDFVRHFPPATIMEGLEDEPQLRANILVASTGVRLKVALKKSAASCGSDLQIALEEQETNAETVVRLFEPDDRVRFLDNRALWSFVTEGNFWQVEARKDAKTHALAVAHISYLIDRAMEDQLLTHRDVVRGITVASMVELLPRSEMPRSSRLRSSSAMPRSLSRRSTCSPRSASVSWSSMFRSRCFGRKSWCRSSPKRTV